MSKSIRRDWAQRYREQEQAAEMAAKELLAMVDTFDLSARVNMLRVARWYEKWHMLAGPRKLGRLLLDLARIANEELPHG